MFRYGLVFLLFLSLSLPAAAETVYTVYIEAGRDNTLIEDPAGGLSNGAGPDFFVGRTNQPEGQSIRRGVIFFELAEVIPGNAVIQSVSLRLYQDANNADQRLISLHRLLDDWGEGTSFSAGGGGAAATAGDSTWLYSFYPQIFWSHEGGNFTGQSSAWQNVGGIGFYTGESTDSLIKDVEFWLKKPNKNFGWIIIGDEDNPQTVKRFASRENPDARFQPLLEVTYSLASY
jgi:hypothetical protein